MGLQTPLGRVRGLGSAKSGVEHFLHQRLTAAALVPLTLWFVWSVVRFVGAPHDEVIAFLSDVFNASAMLLFLMAGLYHMVLGLQVVVEDYVRNDAVKIFSLFVIKFAAICIATVSVISVLRIAV